MELAGVTLMGRSSWAPGHGARHTGFNRTRVIGGICGE
jgi:hypothetical protein